MTIVIPPFSKAPKCRLRGGSRRYSPIPPPAEIVEPAQSNLFELESDRGRPRYSLNTVFNRAVTSLRVARAAASLKPACGRTTQGSLHENG